MTLDLIEVNSNVPSDLSAVEGDRQWVGLSGTHLAVIWTERVQLEHVRRTT
jgi:hypothetical protein